MKKYLILATAILFAFSSCGGGKVADGATSVESQGPRYEASSAVAYINMDSLVSNYQMFKDLSGEFEVRAKKAEAELTSKGRSLERGMADLQEKGEKGLVTRAQFAEMQEKLARQEQDFYQHREKVQQELSEDNQVMMNNIYHSLSSFLKEFNKDYRYGMILSTSGGSPVLHADPALDITQEVITGLNTEYVKAKK